MAAPNYTTDLTTLAIGSITVDAGTWDESWDAWWDTGGAMVDDANLYYNGSACVSAQLTKDSNGSGATWPATIMYVHTAAFTIPTDWAALIHHLWAAPPALNTIANGGIKVLAWTDLANFYWWNASGSDFAPAPRGWWANYAINPAIGTPDDTVGTITTYNMIGMAVAATAQARWNPNACNAVRYWRCESRFTDWDIANWYATFVGFSAIDSAIANKWNLIDPVEWGYKFQWLMSLWLTATSVDFRDANVVINIINTINVTSNFNKIEVHNATSNIEWVAVSISALWTVSKWKFEVIDDAVLSFISCTFTDMDTFIFKSNSYIDTTIFRRCNWVTLGLWTLDNCTFDKSTATAAVITDDLDLLLKNTFNSSGTWYAVEMPTLITVNDTMWWDNTDVWYAATDWVTGNETIKVNVDTGVTLTVNVASGATTPTIHNIWAWTVNVVVWLVNFKFTLDPSITWYEWRLYSVTAKWSLDWSVELAWEESASVDNQTYSYTYTVDTPVAVQIISQPDHDYEEEVYYDTLTNISKDFTIILNPDTNN